MNSNERNALLALADELTRRGRAHWTRANRENLSNRLRALAEKGDGNG